MLLRFTIASVTRTRREYKYQEFSFSGGFSKDKKGVEYIVTLIADDGEKFRIYHQPKTDPTMRPYKIMYVDARRMVSRDGTKYSPEDEGVYHIRRLYSKEQFAKEVAAQRERILERQKADAAELERLATY
jgi:hypothetical protein